MFPLPWSFRDLNVILLADIPDILKPYDRKRLNMVAKKCHPDKTDDERMHECCKYVNALKDRMTVAGCTTVAHLCAAQDPEVTRIRQAVARKRDECANEIARARDSVGTKRVLEPTNVDREDVDTAVADDASVRCSQATTRPPQRPRGRPPKDHVWDASRGYVAPPGCSDARSMPKSYICNIRRMLAAGLFRDKSDICNVTDKMVNRFLMNLFGQLGGHRGRDCRAAVRWCKQHW
tara:strand:- start:613 stop:1317 length:705 start_codon:yes stop_codon:yes gene_type:complete